MKKQLLTLIAYLGILFACMGVLLILHSVTDLAPKQTIEEESLPQSEEQPVQKATPATPSEAEKSPTLVTETEANITGYSRKKRKTKEEVPESTVEEVVVPPPPTVIFASDTHVLAPELSDDGLAFQIRVQRDDGKVLPYMEAMIDTFISEVIAQNPDAVVLSGDLTLDGELKSHEYLATKLSEIQEAGIQVLAIPGNHDINNPNARSYLGEVADFTAATSPEEFREIYQPYGYEQAASLDEDSLSYVYQLDETHWMMMLDTNIYNPKNRVAGRIQLETFEWMKEQFMAAEEAGAVIIPVGHHNLLEESRLYIDECVMENNAASIWLLEEWRVPLYVSGHLHAQRVKKHIPEPGTPKGAYGIYEIVNSPLVVPPCQYGILEWQEDDSMEYRLKRLDVEGWAADQGITDENLLQFETFQEEFFVTIISAQVRKEIKNLSVEQTEEMAQYYASLLRRYIGGDHILTSAERNSKGYQLWERNRPEDDYFAEINDMIKDSGSNNKQWQWLAPLSE